MTETRWSRLQLAGVLSAIATIVIVYMVVNRFAAPAASTSVSSQTFLASLWQGYKQKDWQAGRTVDPQTNNSTTSEGQSYTMLRAVWSNDPTTFSSTWQWTARQLQRSDKLFSWRWSVGASQAGGNMNTASDADTDIALALVLAGNRWHNPVYLAQAKMIIPSIWEQEVVTIQGKPYLTADNLEKNSLQPVLNPSYWAPYAYRIFAGLDEDHPWQQLADQTYASLQAASQQQLGSKLSANLPPDWLTVDRQTGQFKPSVAPGHDTNFGYDALRTIWRVAVDYRWNNNAAAKSTLASFSSLSDFWNHDQKLYAIYTHAGQPAVRYESPAMYGATLNYFAIMHPATARDIYTAKLQPLYNSRTHQFASSVGYYENNWLWFGLALYDGQLPNLSSGGPA